MDYLNTLWESRHMVRELAHASTFRVDHRANTIEGIRLLNDDYDLFLLDRDGTLQEYHATAVPAEFKDALQQLGPKAEILSNSSYDELRRIRDIFPGIPVSKMVMFERAQNMMHLLRFCGGKLSVWRYDGPGLSLIDDTSRVAQGETLYSRILRHYKKPDPSVIHAAMTVNTQTGRVQIKPKTIMRTVMVGDRYLTDIAAGNLANAAYATRRVDTAMVKPYGLLAEWKSPLLAAWRGVDLPIGALLSRVARVPEETVETD